MPADLPAWQQPLPLFLGAALIAAFAASSELIGRFKDAPFRVLVTWPGLAFLSLNAGLAVGVLWALRLGSKPNTATLALEQVLLAGFGARVIARTKVVGVRGKEGQEQEIGPGAVFEKILAAVSRRADRDRAPKRLRLMNELLEGMPWERVRSVFSYEMAGAMQDLTPEEREHAKAAVKAIAEDPALDDPTRVHMLGYLVLDYAGEDFLRELVALYKKRYPA